MAFSFKHYAFAATALAGVYSAQITVGLMPLPHDVARTIAQVEVVELTQENALEQISKQNEALTANIALAESQLAESEQLTKVSELKELKKRHQKLESESNESFKLFKKSVESFLSAQTDEYDPSAVEEAMANLDEAQVKVALAFKPQKIDEAIEEARDAEAVARDERINSLQGMLCQQKESLAALKDELSSKLSELTELVSTQNSSPIYSPDFAMPWAQMQNPFSQMFNPFSFLGGSMNSFNMGAQTTGMGDAMSQFSSIPGFGLGAGSGFTQNNFYGQTSFNAYNMAMPQFPMRQREPSQIQQQAVEQQQVAPAFIPNVTRGPVSDDGSFSF